MMHSRFKTSCVVLMPVEGMSAFEPPVPAGAGVAAAAAFVKSGNANAKMDKPNFFAVSIFPVLNMLTARECAGCAKEVCDDKRYCFRQERNAYADSCI